jgi:hypothetical protein
MNKQTSFQCMSMLLGLLLCMATAQARDAVLMIQGHVSAPSCNAQALSTAMATGLRVLQNNAVILEQNVPPGPFELP